MRTHELAAHLDVSYRRLDYLTRRPDAVITNADLGAGVGGSGTRRVWPARIVARLEVARALADATSRMDVSNRANRGGFPYLAEVTLSWSGDVPMAGWAFLDDTGDLTIADTLDGLADAIDQCGGGVVARFVLSDVVAEALAAEAAELVPA